MASKDLLTDIFADKFTVAEDVAKQPLLVRKLVLGAGGKLRKLGGLFIFFTSLKDNAGDIRRMLLAYYDGKYKTLPWESLVKGVVAILYLVSFVDFIPDFIPVIGLMDDFMVIGWVVNSIREDIEKFKLWESTQPIVINEQDNSRNSNHK